MNRNQMIADRLNDMELSDRARDIINDTDIILMDVLFGDLESAEQVESFIRENYSDAKAVVVGEHYSSDDKIIREVIDGGCFEAATMLMDDDIREALNREYAPCSDEEFLIRYMDAHLLKYGEEFLI